jgi:hypothetical protein
MAEVLLDMPIMELLGSSETGGPQTTGTEPEFVNLLKVVTNEKGEAIGEVLTIIC